MMGGGGGGGGFQAEVRVRLVLSWSRRIKGVEVVVVTVRLLEYYSNAVSVPTACHERETIDVAPTSSRLDVSAVTRP